MVKKNHSQNDMQSSFTYGIHGMVWLMDVIANQLLKTKYGITFRKFYVLAVLSSCEPSTQANLADYLGQSTAAVSKSLAVLEADGFVKIQISAEHKRKNTVELTEKGRDLTMRASQELEQLLHENISSIGIDMNMLIADTNAIRNRLEEVAGQYQD